MVMVRRTERGRAIVEADSEREVPNADWEAADVVVVGSAVMKDRHGDAMSIVKTQLLAKWQAKFKRLDVVQVGAFLQEEARYLGRVKVVSLRASGEVGVELYGHDGWFDPEFLEHVRVVASKPRRTLKLSEGLQWLGVMRYSLKPIARAERDGFDWEVWSTVVDRVARGDTPLRAIIAARKAYRAQVPAEGAVSRG